jgi:hypothetical protein
MGKDRAVKALPLDVERLLAILSELSVGRSLRRQTLAN